MGGQTGRIRRKTPEARELRSKTVEEVRQLHLINVEQLAHELALKLNPPKVLGRSFKELCDAWLTTGCKRRLDTRNEARHVELLGELWPLREGELTPKRVRAALTALLRPAGALGASTVNMVRSKGHLIIREAQLDDDWSGSNPFDLVPRFREDEVDHIPITLEHARAFLPHLRRDRYREAVFNLLLGPRPGEQKALRKVDVDMDRRLVTFRRSNGRNRTKTGKKRIVPIPRDLVALLSEAIEASPSDLVFPESDGTQQRPDKRLSVTLRDAYRKAGIIIEWRAACFVKACGFKERSTKNLDDRCPKCQRRRWRLGYPPPVWWRSLRHAAATLHREAGCDPHVISETLGHAAKRTTEAFYTHVSVEYARRQLNKLKLFR